LRGQSNILVRGHGCGVNLRRPSTLIRSGLQGTVSF
jgi:hypothetical protein